MITAESVSQHLSAVIEGTNIQFNEAGILRLTDLGKVKDIYKLNDDKKANKERRTNSGRGDDLSSESEQIVDKEELEVVVLGLMALRGQS